MTERFSNIDTVLTTADKPRPVADTIYAYLKRAIESGVYSEGDRLPPERQLAEVFKSGRGTIRRALEKLERAGFVHRRLGNGTFIGSTLVVGERVITVADQITPLQLIEARLAMEPFTTGLAVLHITRRYLEEMEAVLRLVEASVNDMNALSKGDAEFHLLIARASANPLLLSVYQQINNVRLRAQWDALEQKILTPDVIADYNRQHRRIYNALKERNAQAAYMLMTIHLEKMRADLVRALQPVTMRADELQTNPTKVDEARV